MLDNLHCGVVFVVGFGAELISHEFTSRGSVVLAVLPDPESLPSVVGVSQPPGP